MHTHSITRASKHMIPIYSWGYSCVLAAFSNMAVTRDKTGKQLHLPANSRSKCQLGKGQDHSWPPSGSLSPGRESTLPWTQGNYSLVSIQKKEMLTQILAPLLLSIPPPATLASHPGELVGCLCGATYYEMSSDLVQTSPHSGWPAWPGILLDRGLCQLA